MSYAWRIRLGILLILAGVGLIIVGFGPLQFADRLSDRVDAPGTVQWGLQVDATSAEDIVGDGQYGAWKVDYEIDGSFHTGVIVGEYSEGQQITVSAPADGSVYAVLREGTPTGLKILSWLVVPGALATIVIGSWWLARGLRAQDARNQQVAREQLARFYPQLFPPPAAPQYPIGAQPAQQPAVGEHGTQPPGGEPGTQPRPAEDQPRRGPDFFAPYDI